MLWWLLACRSPEVRPAPVVEAEPAPVLDPGDAAASWALSFPERAHHRVDVTLATRCGGDGLTLWMPVWTPGSYLVREFSRHVEGLTARDDAGPLPVAKTSKNRWRVGCTGQGPVSVSYAVYARTMSVQAAFVDRELAVLNGAAVLLFPEGDPARPLEVRVTRPDGWASTVSPLPPHPDGDPDHFLVPGVDAVIDGPILVGNPQLRELPGTTVPHWLVTLGEPGPWDQAKAATELGKVAAEVERFWGRVPYRSYWFLNVLGETGGGLEHRDGTLMMTSRWATSSEDSLQSWLGLAAHEHFHAWNVKRMRPVGLGPFDYEAEVYTPSLWIAEGLTSYYDDLLLARAGVLDEAQWIGRMSDNVRKLQQTPGRLAQPVSQASFDAWIGYYRKDENTVNAGISYYTKGAVLGWLLDAEIRRATDDRRSLDDLMRALWERSGEHGYTPQDVRALASELAGRDLGPFFDRYVDGVEELDYGGALQWWGLRWKAAEAAKEPAPGWLGASTADRGGRIVVTEVPRGTPAWDAGLAVDDELLAFGGERVSDLSTLLNRLGAGWAGEVLVARRGRVLPIVVLLGDRDPRTWTLEPDPGASPIATRRRSAWLGR